MECAHSVAQGGILRYNEEKGLVQRPYVMPYSKTSCERHKVDLWTVLDLQPVI